MPAAVPAALVGGRGLDLLRRNEMTVIRSCQSVKTRAAMLTES